METVLDNAVRELGEHGMNGATARYLLSDALLKYLNYHTTSDNIVEILASNGFDKTEAVTFMEKLFNDYTDACFIEAAKYI